MQGGDGQDLLFAGAWAYGLVRREVDWRGTRIVVGPGSRVLAAGVPLHSRRPPTMRARVSRTAAALVVPTHGRRRPATAAGKTASTARTTIVAPVGSWANQETT